MPCYKRSFDAGKQFPPFRMSIGHCAIFVDDPGNWLTFMMIGKNVRYIFQCCDYIPRVVRPDVLVVPLWRGPGTASDLQGSHKGLCDMPDRNEILDKFMLTSYTNVASNLPKLSEWPALCRS